VVDDPADHDREGEEADQFADAYDCSLREYTPMPQGPSKPLFPKNYSAARGQVGLSDSYMLQQVHAQPQKQEKRMQAHEQRAQAQTEAQQHTLRMQADIQEHILRILSELSMQNRAPIQTPSQGSDLPGRWVPGPQASSEVVPESRVPSPTPPNPTQNPTKGGSMGKFKGFCMFSGEPGEASAYTRSVRQALKTAQSNTTSVQRPDSYFFFQQERFTELGLANAPRSDGTQTGTSTSPVSQPCPTPCTTCGSRTSLPRPLKRTQSTGPGGSQASCTMGAQSPTPPWGQCSICGI
jgi:hypothetical protein